VTARSYRQPYRAEFADALNVVLLVQESTSLVTLTVVREEESRGRALGLIPSDLAGVDVV
jgi:hypothetical protein